MSLNISIDINGIPISSYVITRVEGGTDPDSIGEYKWYQRNQLVGGGKPAIGGWIDHRYGDGAEALVLKMLQAYEEIK